MAKCNIYNCNIYEAQKYIKHKWIPIIIFLIGKEKEVNFSFLLNNIEYISNKRLSDSLNKLKEENIVFKDENNNFKFTNDGKYLYEIIIIMSKFRSNVK